MFSHWIIQMLSKDFLWEKKYYGSIYSRSLSKLSLLCFLDLSWDIRIFIRRFMEYIKRPWWKIGIANTLVVTDSLLIPADWTKLDSKSLAFMQLLALLQLQRLFPRHSLGLAKYHYCSRCFHLSFAVVDVIFFHFLSTASVACLLRGNSLLESIDRIH